MTDRCPGQDRRAWRPEDTTEVPCPKCRTAVEFMKDEFSRECPNCGERFGDPARDAGCARWCPGARDCLGIAGAAAGPIGVHTGNWRCSSCGHVYEVQEGDPEHGAGKGTAWGNLPSDWKCPRCGSARGQFREVLL